MNKFILSLVLFASLIPTSVIFSKTGKLVVKQNQEFTMVPGNYLRITAFTSYSKKCKNWEWQPNKHFNLVKYSEPEVCGNHYHQVWLFQAFKPGNTELVFTRKKKKTYFNVEILKPIPNPNVSTAQAGMFDMNRP